MYKCKYKQLVTVIGNDSFPVDMLRYDKCIPEKEHDSCQIASTFFKHNDDYTKVQLVRYIETKNDNPTIGRWKSFSWNVIDVKTVQI